MIDCYDKIKGWKSDEHVYSKTPAEESSKVNMEIDMIKQIAGCTKHQYPITQPNSLLTLSDDDTEDLNPNIILKKR